MRLESARREGPDHEAIAVQQGTDHCRIACVLDAGISTAEVCRKQVFSSATF
jgi:hypothetical protein